MAFPRVLGAESKYLNTNGSDTYHSIPRFQLSMVHTTRIDLAGLNTVNAVYSPQGLVKPAAM